MRRGRFYYKKLVRSLIPPRVGRPLLPAGTVRRDGRRGHACSRFWRGRSDVYGVGPAREGADVLPVRERRRGKGQLPVRVPDAPGGVQARPGEPPTTVRCSGPPSAGSSATSLRRSAGWSGRRTSRSGCAARSARSKGNNAEVLEVCEQAFNNNPWDVQASLEAADAAVAMGLTQLGVFYVESVQAQAGDDTEFFRRAAEVFKANHEFPKAISCWEKVKKIDPNDQDARHEINALYGQRDDQALRPGRGDRQARRRSGRGGEARPRRAQEGEAHARGAAGPRDQGTPRPRRPVPRASSTSSASGASSTRPRRCSPRA